MKYGLVIFPTAYTPRPDELARAAEERGFESLFFPEHTHIPKSRRSPYPGGGELPREYSNTLDPFVALMQAAAVTKTLKLATGVCLLIEHNPITVAKQVATLDLLSGGRFIFGIGGGWNAEEMEDHGTDFKRRWKLLRERVEAMKAIWTTDDAAYHGELVNFDPMWSWPKPVQRPYPPIILGNNGPGAERRVVRYCDGWLPHAMRVGNLAERLARLRQMAEQAGRDPATISITVFGAPAEKDRIREYESLGAERVVFFLPAAEPKEVFKALDEQAHLIRD
jgi:probable F420-dependent oxidoreductase